MDSLRMTSEKPMSFEDLTDYLFTLTTVAWGKDWGVFTVSSPTTTEAKTTKFPQITYSLLSMVPGVIGNESRREIKPRYRETKRQEDGSAVQIKSQIMDCTVGFYIYGTSNREVDELSYRFMDLIEESKAFLKKNGLKEMIFKGLKTIQEYSNTKEVTSSRYIEYLVRLEYHTETPLSIIQQIEVEAKTIYEKMREAGELPSQQK